MKKTSRIRNPLIRRVPREFVCDWRKYAVIFLFLVLMIGAISGLCVSNDSMLQSLNENVTRLKLEDGHFELAAKADSDLLDRLQKTKVSVKIKENFYKDEKEDNNLDGKKDGTIRLYARGDKLNRADLFEGKLPEKSDEIAIDHRHAGDAGVEIGDTIRLSGKKYKVTGFVSYVNYSTMYEKNTDVIFDALHFDVGMVTKEGFDRLPGETHYNYAWNYTKRPKDAEEEKKLSDKYVKEIAKETMASGNAMTNYLPSYLNRAIHFAPDDMENDKTMGAVMLYVLVAVLAFIFALTISSTIEKESSVIGTLRAMGFTKVELIRHYLSVPVIVTLISGLIGNLLGYTLFKDLMMKAYYNSYSLPRPRIYFNMDALVQTTLLPIVIMFVVNLFIITRSMQHTPLQFLRGDLRKKKREKAVRLPAWSFLRRFRLRIILQNFIGYVVLMLGIFSVSVMLILGIGMPATLDYYKDNAGNMMFANYQYVLKSCVDETGKEITTENSDAEKFDLRELELQLDMHKENVSVYGVTEDSSYISIPDNLTGKSVWISDDYAEKFGQKVGDTITLREKYEDKEYSFKVRGIVTKASGISVFMPRKNFETRFGLEEGQFTGYFSDTKIKDIKEAYIASVITSEAITRMAGQLDHSMGAIMKMFQVICIILAVVLLYLLTKIIIEKNEGSISMTKILGYRNKEIASLYITSTTIVVILADLISVFTGTEFLSAYWNRMMMDYDGYFAFHMGTDGLVKSFVFILISYIIVMIIDYHRISKVPMGEALKAME